MNFEKQSEMLHRDASWFRTESLRLLGEQLKEQNCDTYPPFHDRLWDEDDLLSFEPINVPIGPWETSNGQVPTLSEQAALHDKGIRLDAHGRPLHPWFDAMVTDPNVRILTGMGRYWHWGPNYTADPVIFRRDLDEAHVLLVLRTDTLLWALPGGFIDPGEAAQAAAVREAWEETALDLTLCAPQVDFTYQGPLADLRVTANAWPETTAVRFEIPDNIAQTFTQMEWEGPDLKEVLAVAWTPVSQISDKLFGSHKLLIEQALHH